MDHALHISLISFDVFIKIRNRRIVSSGGVGAYAHHITRLRFHTFSLPTLFKSAALMQNIHKII